jgi:hypothetical protein
MTIGQEFLKEVEAELNASRRLVQRVPGDNGRWKPHPKSSALGHLTQLVRRMPKVMSDIVKGIDLDLAGGPGYTFAAVVRANSGREVNNPQEARTLSEDRHPIRLKNCT